MVRMVNISSKNNLMYPQEKDMIGISEMLLSHTVEEVGDAAWLQL